MKDCPDQSVLVTNLPPKGLLDKSSGGRSLGSVAVMDTIVRTRPRLVVCGHIHESGGRQETTGSTVIINADPVGIEWTLDT